MRGNVDVFIDQSFIEKSLLSDWPKMLVSAISAGFPSPAADFIDLEIDLHREIVKNPATTFFGRVKGTSMTDAHIDDKDILVIDKSRTCKNNSIAVCFLDGEFLVKRIEFQEKGCWLMAANENYEPIWVAEDHDFMVWGVVTTVIKFL